jgi:hypothetical protein
VPSSIEIVVQGYDISHVGAGGSLVGIVFEALHFDYLKLLAVSNEHT